MPATGSAAPAPPSRLAGAAGAAADAAASPAAEIRVLEVDAFASVQDLIHAAILANKGAASLKEVGGVPALPCPVPPNSPAGPHPDAPAAVHAVAENMVLPCACTAQDKRCELPCTLACQHLVCLSQPASQLISMQTPALPACTTTSPPPPLQIYGVCQSNGRIAYKRAGGSRLITSNDHWKSQMRHALYTGDRFQR